MKITFSKSLMTAILIFVFTQARPQANTSLSNLASTAVNVNLLPGSDNSVNLGSSAKSWKDIYMDGILYIDGFPFLSMPKSSNICVGTYAGHNLSSDGDGCTFVGYNSGYYNTSGDYNSALGEAALKNNSTGWYNSAFGYTALYFNTTGARNSAHGSWSLHDNTTGYDNSAFGYYALYDNTTGNSNTAVGNYALNNNTTGYDNSAIGINALNSNTTGHANTASGIQSLNFNTTGNFNTASGRNALFENTIGGYNTGIGYGAGGLNDNDTYCSFFGYDADQSVTTDFTNSMALGNTSRITASNQVRIGNSSITSIGGYAGWSNISDGRYKKDVRENVPGLEFISKLKPVTYHLDVSGIRTVLGEDKSVEKADGESSVATPSSADEMVKQKEQIIYSGFIAQEVEKAANEIGYDFSGVDAPKNENDLYGLRYAEFVVPLVKAVQELDARETDQMSELAEMKIENEKLRSENTKQQNQVDEQQKQIDELKSQVNQLLSSASLNEGTSKVGIGNDAISYSLGQNIPNPFDNTTLIPVRTPKDCSNASIIITDDASGRVIKVIPIACAETQVRVDAHTLASGSYSYSLIVDGRRVETKQMIINK